MPIVHLRARLCRGLIFVAALSLASANAQATIFTDVFFFGASAADTGNNGPADFDPTFAATYGYDPDRWTNLGGNLWPEIVAAGLGFPTAGVASSDGGNNYAVGGQRADEFSIQISALSTAEGGVLDPTALYAIAAGGNDLLQGETAASTVTDIVNNVNALQALGAQYFVVFNQSDFSALAPGGGPLGAVAPIPPNADIWANDFNIGLAAALPGITGATIWEFDAASLLDPIFADPVGNGFSEGLNLCADDPNCVAGVGTEDFLMMDHVHMMSGAHDLIGASVLATVPEPSTALLLGLGLVMLGARSPARRFGSSK